MNIIINMIGLIAIVFIIWWFWLSKPKATKALQGNLIEVKVKDGVYQPSFIQVKVNQPITLRFIREDASPCADIVTFPSLNISKALPVNIAVDIQFTLEQMGEYEFTCQMGMYRGKLIASE